MGNGSKPWRGQGAGRREAVHHRDTESIEWWTGCVRHELEVSNSVEVSALPYSPFDGVMQLTDDFSDLGGQPSQAFYRMRYKP